MTKKEYLALYYGIDVNLPNKKFYNKIKYINQLATEHLLKIAYK